MTADTEARDEQEHLAHPPDAAERQLAQDLIVEPAEASASLSGRSLLRKGVARWLLTGMMRVLYRTWTRVAARVFPEDSLQARLAERVGIPLPDTLNLSWITPQLAVGGRIHPEDIARLAALGVTAVVDTRSEHRDDERALGAEGIQLLYLPTPDTFPLTLEQLDEGTQWVTRQIAAGGKVLIHCEHGVGRSVLLTAATLVAGGMSADVAMSLVRRGRWQAAPNHRQMVRLQAFERAIHASA